MRKTETCIECNLRDARHWRSLLCEDCFRKFLNDDWEERREKEKGVLNEK